MDERTYYEQGNVKVTNARFVSDKQTFAIRNITSFNITEEKPSRGGSVFFMIAGVVLLFAQPLVGIIVFALALLTFNVQKPSFNLKIRTAGGEVTALNAKDRTAFNTIAEALNNAIAGTEITVDKVHEAKKTALRRRKEAEEMILSSGDPDAIKLLMLARENPRNYSQILAGGQKRGNSTLKTALGVMTGVVAGSMIANAMASTSAPSALDNLTDLGLGDTPEDSQALNDIQATLDDEIASDVSTFEVSSEDFTTVDADTFSTSFVEDAFVADSGSFSYFSDSFSFDG